MATAPRPRRPRLESPRETVDAAVSEAFTRFDVASFGVDPSPARDDETDHLYWAELIDAWHTRYGKLLKRRGRLWAKPGRDGHSVLFDMRTSIPGGKDRVREFTAAAEQTAHDIDVDSALIWDGHPILRTHVLNAKRRPNPWGVSLGKVTRDSTLPVDAAVSMVGARMLRHRVMIADATHKPTGAAAGF